MLTLLEQHGAFSKKTFNVRGIKLEAFSKVLCRLIFFTLHSEQYMTHFRYASGIITFRRIPLEYVMASCQGLLDIKFFALTLTGLLFHQFLLFLPLLFVDWLIHFHHLFFLVLDERLDEIDEGAVATGLEFTHLDVI